jgi:hypothetical protein
VLSVPFLRVAAAVTLKAASIAGIVATPDISGNRPQGFLFVLPALPLLYLVGVALYLPYRIRILDGILTVGVVGVPQVGRARRSLSVDLSDVQRWQITLSPRFSAPAERPTRRRASGSEPRAHRLQPMRTICVDPAAGTSSPCGPMMVSCVGTGYPT